MTEPFCENFFLHPSRRMAVVRRSWWCTFHEFLFHAHSGKYYQWRDELPCCRHTYFHCAELTPLSRCQAANLLPSSHCNDLARLSLDSSEARLINIEDACGIKVAFVMYALNKCEELLNTDAVEAPCSGG